MWEKRVATAFRRGTRYSFSLLSKSTRECEGDALGIEVRVRGQRTGQTTRLCNIYSAPVFDRPGGSRPVEEGDWEALLGDGKGVIAGDFNSNSKRWDHEDVREGGGAARWTIGLIDDFNLRACNSGEATYFKNGSSYSSAIDLTLAGSEVQVEKWEVIKDDEATTGSDHEVISWEVNVGPKGGSEEEEAPRMSWKIDKLLGNQERVVEASRFWESLMESGPALEAGASREQIEAEARLIQDSMIRALDLFAKRARICAR